MMKIVILVFFLLGLGEATTAEPSKEYILFKPGKDRIRSRIVLPTDKNATFSQANYFELVDGNPIIQVWIEKELKEELKEASPNTSAPKEINPK